MRRLQAGERTALAELYDRYTPLMLGLALRILRDRADAEDAVQEAWVQVWNRRAAYDPARGNVASWLVTIARTRALDRTRRNATRGRAESAPDAPAPSAAPHPEDEAMRSSVGEALARALAEIDPKQRQVLEIAYFEGLSQSQVAERLNAPLGTVKYWMRQGLLRLRALVPENGS